MNEKKRKKLFGVFNIVDILLILIVLLGAVIGWKLLDGKGRNRRRERSIPML